MKNFRAFLTEYAKTEETKAKLTQWSSVNEVLPYLAQLIPIYKAGKSDLIVKGFCDEFGTQDDAFKTKVGRYVEMFCEVLLS